MRRCIRAPRSLRLDVGGRRFLRGFLARLEGMRIRRLGLQGRRLCVIIVGDILGECSFCSGREGEANGGGRHVFKGEGYDTPTDERHCVNSVSLKFKDEA